MREDDPANPVAPHRPAPPIPLKTIEAKMKRQTPLPQSPSMIGPLRMSGLIIGPILGSGIIILPPLAQQLAGDWAIAAWTATVCISLLFAWIFGRLSLLFLGDSGVAAAVEAAFGPQMKKLTSFYLIGAVFFGPVAALLTIARYIALAGDPHGAGVGVVLSLMTTALLLRRLAFIGTVALIASSATTCILFGGSVATLLEKGVSLMPASHFQVDAFLYTLLLLFWSVVGWEVIGNYSGEIENPKKNLPRAVAASALVIAVVTLVVAAGMQTLHQDGTLIAMDTLIIPLCGPLASTIMGVLVILLCGCAVLLFVGGVARLMASLGDEGILPRFLAHRSVSGAPSIALGLLFLVHLALFGGVHLAVIDIEHLVAIANGFFLCNALIGIFSAMRLFGDYAARASGTLLSLILLLILFHSSWLLLAFLAAIACFILMQKRQHGAVSPSNAVP